MRNSCHVMPLVALLALAAFHSSPHCFMTLCAWAAPVAARARALATKMAESATLIEVLIIANPSCKGAAAIRRLPPSPTKGRAHCFSCPRSTEPDMNIS